MLLVHGEVDGGWTKVFPVHSHKQHEGMDGMRIFFKLIVKLSRSFSLRLKRGLIRPFVNG